VKHPSLKTWQFIYANLLAEKPVMLIYVLESKGSSPGRQGFFMAVADNGMMEGSIGGGIMEHKFVELAKQQLLENRSDLFLKRQVHDSRDAKERSGMICSGEQTLLLYPITSKDAQPLSAMIRSIEGMKNGTLQLSNRGLSFTETAAANNYYFQNNAADSWTYREKTGFKNNLTIVGGGHCALALSALFSTMDYHITIYEERKGLKTVIENTYAHQIELLSSYEELETRLEERDNQYVVIMTFGYRTDEVALRALKNKSFRYIGVLGSASKMEKLLGNNLAKEGLKWIDQIHAPVGINIHSQTPTEIAISIAAEIIREKNKPTI
jgi:xanthine dehydrogenase accessory factor